MLIHLRATKRTLLFAIMVLSLCVAAAGCAVGTQAGNGRTDIVHTLCAEEIIGELPPDISALNGDQAAHPCFLVGTISTVNDEEYALRIRISPSIATSELGDISSSIELPASLRSEASALSDLWGIILCSENFQFEITCAFPLEAAFETSLDEKIVWNDGIWVDGDTTGYIFPVSVINNGEYCYFKSLMDGSEFRPAGRLPEEIVEMAICEKDIGATISIDHCGIATFTILSNESISQYSVQLESFLKLPNVPKA